MRTKQVFYSGHVQGVGFRYTVKQVARGFDVTGWVRNLPDGRVELQVTGEEPEITAFLNAVATGELETHIRDQQVHEIQPATSFSGFAIRG